MGHEGDNKQWGKLSRDSGILAKICSCCVLNRKKANVVQLGPLSLFPLPPPPLFGEAWTPPPPPPELQWNAGLERTKVGSTRDDANCMGNQAHKRVKMGRSRSTREEVKMAHKRRHIRSEINIFMQLCCFSKFVLVLGGLERTL